MALVDDLKEGKEQLKLWAMLMVALTGVIALFNLVLIFKRK